MPLENEIFQKACHVIILVAKAWALPFETGNRRNQSQPARGQCGGLLHAEVSLVTGLATMDTEPSHMEAN